MEINISGIFDKLSTVKEKSIPILETIRNIIMFIAEMIAKQFDLVTTNVYNFMIVLIALWIARKFFKFGVGQENWWKYLILAGGLFYVIRFL